MTWQRSLGTTGVIAVVLFTTIGLAAGAAASQSGATTAAAALASPELVGALSKELGVNLEQAAGAAGTLFGVAQSRLKPEEFSQVSNAVPGMDALLKAAPTGGAAIGTTGALSQLGGSVGWTCGRRHRVLKAGSQARDGEQSNPHPDVIRDEIWRCKCRAVARRRTQVVSGFSQTVLGPPDEALREGGRRTLPHGSGRAPRVPPSSPQRS